MRKISIMFVLSVLSASSFAGDYSAELLNLGVGGRACSMGEAQTAITDDGFSGWWNPAAILTNQRYSLSAMRSMPFGLFDFNFLELGVSIHNFNLFNHINPKLAVSISFASLDIDSIPHFSDNRGTTPLGFFSNQEQAYFLTVAYSYFENINTGINVKYIRHGLYDSTGSGIGLDLGTNYNWDNNKLLVGAVLKDIGGTEVIWNTGEKDERKMNFSLGIAYNIAGLLTSVDLCYEHEFAYKIGCEYSIKNLLFLRGGLDKGTTFGIGTHIPLSTKGFSSSTMIIAIDYAFSTKDFGNTNNISLSLLSPVMHLPVKKKDINE